MHLTYLVLIVIVIIILVFFLNNRREDCSPKERRGCGCVDKCKCKKEKVCLPPSNVSCVSTKPFTVEITWNSPPKSCDVSHYLVYVHYGELSETQECDKVYDKIYEVEPCKNKIIIQDCESSTICVCVKTVCRGGMVSESSAMCCSEVNCNITTNGWIVKRKCNGLKIKWNKKECATQYNIYYQNEGEEPVLEYEFPAGASGAKGLAIPSEGQQILISVVSGCGEGDLTVISDAEITN